MSDFDFDELDKAVSGALSSDAPSNELIDTLDTHNADVASQSDNQSSSLAPVATPARQVAPAARRSSGRFMDVVHPSSDMRPGSETTKPSPAPVAIKAPQQRVTQQNDTPVVETDFEQSVNDLYQGEAPKPLESPFLTDAKVEKRPLGGEAPTTTEFDPAQLLEEPDDPRIEAHTMPDPIDFAAQPVLAEEAEQKEEISQATIDSLNLEPHNTEEPAAHSEAPVHVAVASEAAGYGEGSFQPEADSDIPAGPTSIHQQYKEQPSSTPESGSIYDTEAYHQPLAHGVKKKKPSFAILWIILILLLGAGAGAAFYFYVLPLI